MSVWNPFYNQPSTARAPLQLRLITFNLGSATSSSAAADEQRPPWAERRPRIAQQLRHELRYASPAQTRTEVVSGTANANTAAFVCLQGASRERLRDVLRDLNGLPAEERTVGEEGDYRSPDGPHWADIGLVRRDDDEEDDDVAEGVACYCPILYPVNTFHCPHEETAQLGEVTGGPSSVLTAGVFEHRQTGQRLVAANARLDDGDSGGDGAGDVDGAARRQKEAVERILHTLQHLQRVHSTSWPPQVPRRTSAATVTLGVFLAVSISSHGGGRPEPSAWGRLLVEDGWLRDLHGQVPAPLRYGDVATFTGFRQPDDSVEGDGAAVQGRADSLWLGPARNVSAIPARARDRVFPWTPVGYAVLPNVFDDGVYLSDHRAVVGDATL